MIYFINLIQDLGYNGDVGYQTFLYSNVGDIRRVFMFLIEKLPREVEKPCLEPDGTYIPPSYLVNSIIYQLFIQSSYSIIFYNTNLYCFVLN